MDKTFIIALWLCASVVFLIRGSGFSVRVAVGR